MTDAKREGALPALHPHESCTTGCLLCRIEVVETAAYSAIDQLQDPYGKDEPDRHWKEALDTLKKILRPAPAAPTHPYDPGCICQKCLNTAPAAPTPECVCDPLRVEWTGGCPVHSPTPKEARVEYGTDENMCGLGLLAKAVTSGCGCDLTSETAPLCQRHQERYGHSTPRTLIFLLIDQEAALAALKIDLGVQTRKAAEAVRELGLLWQDYDKLRANKAMQADTTDVAKHIDGATMIAEGLYVADKSTSVFNRKKDARAEAPSVLDASCGSRMFWFDRSDPRCLFLDNRSERHELTDSSSSGGKRTLIIEPDMVGDFTALPFEEDRFHLVVFDPPHLVHNGKKGWLAKKYGKLGDNWQDDVRRGFAECFRVLRPLGTLIFKWNENDIPVSQVIALTDARPLIGNRCGKNAKSHWIVYQKPARPPVREDGSCCLVSVRTEPRNGSDHLVCEHHGITTPVREDGTPGGHTCGITTGPAIREDAGETVAEARLDEWFEDEAHAAFKKGEFWYAKENAEKTGVSKKVHAAELVGAIWLSLRKAYERGLSDGAKRQK